MGPPPIALFMTTIASQPALRQKQEYYLRILQAKKIPFTTYDLASDPEAKKLWRSRAPKDKQQLPGMLVGLKYPGDFAAFEDAVEHDELDIFLRRNEEYDPYFHDHIRVPEAQPVGIPGAMTPLQMTPDRLKAAVKAGTPSNSPLKGAVKPIPVNRRTNELDAGDLFNGFGLQGVKVTEDELSALIAELGMDEKDAKSMAKGLSGADSGDKDEQRETGKPVLQTTDSVVSETKETTEGKVGGDEPSRVEDKADTEETEAKPQEEIKDKGKDKESSAALP